MKLCPRKSLVSLLATSALLTASPARAQIIIGATGGDASEALPPAPALAPGGVYFGLLQNDSLATSGYVRVVLTRGGRGSVAVVIGNEKPCVVPVFVDPSTGGLNPLPGGDADMQIELHLDLQPDGRTVLVGKVFDDGHEILVEAPKVAPRAGATVRPLGRFTFVLGTAWTGDGGCGAVKVAVTGAVRGVVRLPDGRVGTAGGNLSEAGGWPLYVATKPAGVLSGAVAFATNGQLSGMLQLRNPATQTAEETETTHGLFGGQYRSDMGFIAPTARRAFTAELRAAPVAALAFTQHGRLTSADLLMPLDAASHGLWLTLQRATGWIFGRTKTADGMVYRARGVMLSPLGEVRGFFRQPNAGTFAIVGMAASASGSSGGSTTSTNRDLTTTGGLTKTGSGTLTLSGSSTYTGDTIVNAGTLDVGLTKTGTGTQFIPISPYTGGTLNFGGTSSATLLTTGVGTLNFSGSNTYAGSDSLLQVGALNISSGNSSVATTVTSGTLNFGGSSILTPVTAGNVVISGTVMLNLGSNVVGINTLVIQTPIGTHGLALTDELENPVTFEILHDGDYVLIGTRRYHVTRATPDGPVTLTFSPLPGVTP